MKRTSACPSCGRDSFPEDAFCSYCGTRLQARRPDTGVTRRTIVKETTATADRLACGSCNSPILAGETFCSTCGARYGTVTSEPRQREVRAEILGKLEEATRGRFEFVREIGRGGMGAVYLARELELERNVAIKVLSSSWLMDGSMVERFRREARTIASLRHPSIVHVHGVGRADDIHYFIMDFIDGVSLGKILLTHGPLSIPATLAILGQIGSALSYAHRPGRSVIHRDIKPGNIMVDAEGNAYVTDFGISKATESHSGLTMTGLIMGTPEYMSPEQCRGDAAGPPSDQYALGAVAFAMLTGSPPFTGPHYRVLVGHTSESPPGVRELRPDCPEDIADAVARMLAKLPGDRWPDISNAMSALGARPVLPDDPVREELAALVSAAKGRRETGPTPEVARPRPTLGAAKRPGDRPTWLRILSLPESLEAGDAVDLRARKGFADGREVENGDISWQSTDPAIARIDPDTGRLVAVGAGTAVITAAIGGVEESVAVNVAPARVTQLSVQPASLELEAGASEVLEAQARGRNDLILDRPVLWSSSDPGVATVSGDGEVFAHREGTASLLAHCDGVGASATVTVVPAKVGAVRFADAPDTMHVGETARLSADARDARGNRIDREIVFSTADSSIARVSGDGTVDALAEGTLTVIAECEGHSTSAEIRVLPPPVAAIRIEAPAQPITAGETVHLSATALDAAGASLDREFVWKSSDRSIIDALRDGTCLAISEGTAEIIVACDGVIERIELEVRPVPVSAVEVSSPPSELVQGDTFHLVATPLDPDGQPMQREIDWVVDDHTVIESLGGGRFRALAAGSASVTARSGEAESVRELIVDPVRVSSIVIATAPESIHVDETVELTASLRDQRGRPLERTVAWTSSDPYVARVNTHGVLEGAGPGSATVSAECEGVSDSTLITVTAAPWATVVFKPDLPAQIPVEAEAAPEPADGEAGPEPETAVQAAVTPETRDPVGAGESGGGERRRLLWLAGVVVVAGAAAAWFGLGGGATDPPTVEPVVANVAILNADGGGPILGALDVVVGDTLHLVARAESDDGTPLTGASIEWTSLNPAQAVIDPAGVLVARSAGAARIVASSGDIRRELAVMVAPPVAEPPVAGTDPPAPRQPPVQTRPAQQAQEEEQPPPPTTEDSPPPVAQAAPPEPPPDGTLQLLVLPFADIWIDGERRATGQRTFELSLPPGPHSLRLENQAMVTVDTTFEILSGQTRVMQITLTPRGS